MPGSKLAARTRRLAATIGVEIKAARLAADVSQEALANAAGMTRSNFARIEGGKTNLTIDSLLRIADGLGLEVEVLLSKPRRRPGR